MLACVALACDDGGTGLGATAGRAIAYVATGPSRSDVYVADADGRVRRNLTAGSPGGGAPAWSPDGRRLVFVGDRDTADETFPDLYVMDADGANVRALTTDHAGDFSPAWSPDGQHVAFARFVPTDGIAIHVVPADGGAPPTRLPGSAFDHSPSWSPDGRRLAVVTDPPSAPGTVVVMNADGSGRTPVADGTLTDVQAVAWAPDGERLAAVAGPHGSPDLRGVYVLDADGSGVRRLPDTEDAECCGGLSWTSDGELLAYNARRDAFAYPAVYRIGVVRADGGAPPKYLESRGDTSYTNAAWRPTP